MIPQNDFDNTSTEVGDGDSHLCGSECPSIGPEDESQLIEDGTKQVLQDFEDQKKVREYARTQAIKNQRVISTSLSMVDWSGFSGAAHSIEAMKERKERR